MSLIVNAALIRNREFKYAKSGALLCDSHSNLFYGRISYPCRRPALVRKSLRAPPTLLRAHWYTSECQVTFLEVGIVRLFRHSRFEQILKVQNERTRDTNFPVLMN